MPDSFFPDLSEAEQLRIIDGCCQAEHEALLKKCGPLYEGLEHTLQGTWEKISSFYRQQRQAGYIEVFLKATVSVTISRDICVPEIPDLPRQQISERSPETYDLQSPVYVGDTMGDFQACEKARVPFIFASYGFGHVENPWKSIKSHWIFLTSVSDSLSLIIRPVLHHRQI